MPARGAIPDWSGSGGPQSSSDTVLKQKSSAEMASHTSWNSELQSGRGGGTEPSQGSRTAGTQHHPLSTGRHQDATSSSSLLHTQPRFHPGLLQSRPSTQASPLHGLPRYFYFQKGWMLYFQLSYCIWDFSFTSPLAQTFPSQTSVPVTAEAPGEGASRESCKHLSFA